MYETYDDKVNAAIHHLMERAKVAPTGSEELRTIYAAKIMIEALANRLELTEAALSFATQKVVQLQSMIQGSA